MPGGFAWTYEVYAQWCTLTSLMILGTSNEQPIMPFSFSPGLRFNATDNIAGRDGHAQDQRVTLKRLYMFKEDSFPSHMAHIDQEWWSLNWPDLNHLHCCTLGIAIRENNQ